VPNNDYAICIKSSRWFFNIYPPMADSSNLLPVHLPFMVAAAKAWMASYRDDSNFWIDYGIGTRVCAWIEETVSS